MSEPDRVRIFDTTLRDGALTPGVAMTLADRLSIAEALERMGVDVIEAGLVGASADETTALRETAALLQEAVVCVLARAATRDIDQAAEALSGARRRRAAEHPIEEVGQKLRDMMPWIAKDALVDKSKN